jgi:DNA-binding NarL/FixJ family response regulator
MDGIAAGVFAAPGITALIVGRPTLFRHGLTVILRDHHQSWTVIEHDSVAAALTARPVRKPDIVLLDERLPDPYGAPGGGVQGGIHGLRQMRGLFPAAKFLILSDDDDRDQVLDFIDAGASGYVTTAANPSQVLAAFNTVLCGGVFIPASPPASVQPASHPTPHPAQRSPHGFAIAGLTERQRDVFDLMARGYPTKLIARELGLAVGTVKVHLAAIYRLLGAHSRTEAVARLVAAPAQPDDADMSALLSGIGWQP